MKEKQDASATRALGYWYPNDRHAMHKAWSIARRYSCEFRIRSRMRQSSRSNRNTQSKMMMMMVPKYAFHAMLPYAQ